MVEFNDGSTLAQASPPDMRLPIALALGWPGRVPAAAAACDWSTATAWEFEPLDDEAFPGVRVARAAGEAGGLAPAMFNAANEECVGAFRAERLPFLGIVDIVSRVVEEGGQQSRGAPSDLTLADVLAGEAWARDCARALIDSLDPTTRNPTR
jgi:1-deoxy-D-xylulose-5-phosphate reductoisomerase